jgi:hypothetical protein
MLVRVNTEECAKTVHVRGADYRQPDSLNPAHQLQSLARKPNSIDTNTTVAHHAYPFVEHAQAQGTRLRRSRTCRKAQEASRWSWYGRWSGRLLQHGDSRNQYLTAASTTTGPTSTNTIPVTSVRLVCVTCKLHLNRRPKKLLLTASQPQDPAEVLEACRQPRQALVPHPC